MGWVGGCLVLFWVWEMGWETRRGLFVSVGFGKRVSLLNEQLRSYFLTLHGCLSLCENESENRGMQGVR